jgi:hypothetical protein
MPLLLRRANISRPPYDWSDDDYDVSDGDRTIGRIFMPVAGRPDDRPWMWTIEWHKRRGPGPHQGNVATREEAMEAFRTAWDTGAGKDPPWLVPGWPAPKE